MTVEVNNEGIIFIGDADIYLGGENTTIRFNVTFNTQEEAERYFNAMRASLDVGCIHIHGTTTKMVAH